jgi:hypothetical protein
MSNNNKGSKADVEQEAKLLSAQEREALKMISTGNDLQSQRAFALLAVDEGTTQKEAAQRSGLTAGQVKYWVGKFRRVRMDMFPEEVLQAEQLEPDQGAADQDVKKTDKAKKTKKTKKVKGKKAKSKKAKKAQGKKAKGKAKKKGKGKKKNKK